MQKKKMALVALALILCVGIVSAAVLPYFGIIKTNVSVDQGVKVDGHSWDIPIETTASLFGGGIYYETHYITNYGDLPATVSFNCTTNATLGELAVGYFINSATLVLENKVPKVGESNWSIIKDGIQAILTYNIVGYTFNYKLLGFNLQKNTNYSLIYYADFDEFGNRFGYWGGNNPGAFIGSKVADGYGNLIQEGSINLGIDLPSTPDANIDFYNYTTLDGYVHAHGAKIWLVPSADYDVSQKKLTAWNPDKYLFETDLISYINLYVTTHYIHPDPATITTLTIPAHTTINFVIRIISKSAAIGTYLVTTTVSPTE